MSIVTKTGDQGQTSLYSGERVAKADARIEAVGALDELNAHLAGLGLETIQSDLFTLGAAVADLRRKDEPEFLAAELKKMEEDIYAMEAALPPLKNFILPGGCPKAIRTHEARAICRRAERHISQVQLLPQNVLPYVNRLSDFLFVFARQLNQIEGAEEVIWNSKK